MLHRLRQALREGRGFTLVELMVVVAVIGILAMITIPAYESMARRSRLTRAENDAQVLVRAVAVYVAHMGALPANLTLPTQDLTFLTQPAVNAQGIVAGPFLQDVPPPPGQNWSPYQLVSNGNGGFQITTSGEGLTVTKP
jgi:prepilin-type N-terminal cleavage/methylation domain-containing protein